MMLLYNSRYGYVPYSGKTQEELKAERKAELNRIHFKNRIKFTKEGKIPYFYPTLNRFYFAYSLKHANKIFPKHLATKLNVVRRWFYIITGL